MQSRLAWNITPLSDVSRQCSVCIMWPGSRCHQPDISWWPPRPPWQCSQACSSPGPDIWSWCTGQSPGRGPRTGESHKTGGSRWGQGHTWDIIRGQLEVTSWASHYHMAVLLWCRHLLWENPPPPDPWDPRKPGLHLMSGKIQFECYLRRHLYDSTVVTSKNCWSRDALWAALLTMGGDPQKSGELAEPWDYGVTMGLHANHYYKTHLRSPLSALAIHDILVQYLNIIVRSEISKVFRSYPQFQNFNKIVVLSNFIVHTFSYLQIGKNKISSIIIWDLCLWCGKRIKLVLLCHYKFDYLISGVMMASRRT